MTKIARAEIDNKAVETKEKPSVEDLSGAFFNRYGHKLDAIINSMSQKQIRRAVINAFGFQFNGYNPKPESDEGKLLWAMDRLVETRTTMFLHSMQEKSVKELKEEYDKNSNLEDTIIAQEVAIIENKKQTEANASKEENNG